MRKLNLGILFIILFFTTHLLAQYPSSNVQVEYMVHMKDKGDSPFVSYPDYAGTIDEGRQTEGFEVRLVEGSMPIRLRYKAHLQNSGDTQWHFLGEYCGTRWQKRRMEAIWIEIIGIEKEKYDIYYQAHIAKIGWSAWYRNGAICGTRGNGLAIEAIKIFVSEKE